MGGFLAAVVKALCKFIQSVYIGGVFLQAPPVSTAGCEGVSAG